MYNPNNFIFFSSFSSKLFFSSITSNCFFITFIEYEKNNKNENEIIKESNKLIEQGKNNKNENENENEQDNCKEDTKILIYEKEKENSKEKEIINQQRIEMQTIEEKKEDTINTTPL